MRLADLAGRRVAILGYGREGHAAERLLGEAGYSPAAVFTGDLPPPSGDGIYRPGLPASDELRRFDVLIRSPGISPYREPLASIGPAGPRVITGADVWFSEHPSARSVVVTGTKGKSTTSALIAHLTRAAGLEVALGGNIGVPLLEIMKPDPEPDLWVIELSSFQITGLAGRPSLAVLLNLFPEHLDWHGTAERYFEDKLSIARGMPPEAVIVNAMDDNLRRHLAATGGHRYFNDPDGIHMREDRVMEGNRQLFGLERFRLPGGHNRSNLCAALSVLRALEIDPRDAAKAVETFRPLPHRLQPVVAAGDIDYVDDSISTTPQSAQAALESFPGRPVCLLLGGYDRGVDWTTFAERIAGRPDLAVVTFGAVGERIAASLEAVVPGLTLRRAGSLKEAVTKGRSLTPPGGVMLLSPGAPSFDAFRNYQERGDQFARLANDGG